MLYILFFVLILCPNPFVFAQANQNANVSELIMDELDQIDNSEISMEVVASKFNRKVSDTGADTTIITKEDFQSTGASTLTEVLRNSGITALDAATSTEKGAALYVRGLSIAYVLVIIDGQRVKDATLALRNISLSQIERIEIIKGPSSYLWGSDAMAGVIYIQTKKGDKKNKGFHGSAGITYGNNFELDKDNHNARPYVDLSYSTGNMVFYGGTSFDYGYNWKSLYDKSKSGTITTNERRDFGSFNVYTGADMDFLDIHNLKMKFTYDQLMTPLSDEERKYNGITELRNPQKFVHGGVSYSVYPTDQLDITLSSGVNYEENHRIFSETPGDYDKEHYIANATELLLSYQINDNFAVKGGYALDFQRRSQLEELVRDHLHYNAINNSLFFGGDYKYRGVVDVDLTIGARYQHNDRYVTEGAGLGTSVENAKDAHSFSPELSFVLKPVKELALKLHVGHSFKSPDLETAFRKDRYSSSGWFIGGNSDITHEKAWGYSGTIEYTPLSGLFMSFGLNRMDIWDLVQFQYTGEEYEYNGEMYGMKRPTNIGRAYTWGVNATIAGAVDVPYVGTLSSGLTVDYTVAKEKRTSSTANYLDQSGNGIKNPWLADRPPVTITGNITWYQPSWGTSLSFYGYYFHSAYNYELIDSKSNTYKLRRTGNQTTFDLRIAQEIFLNKAKTSKSVLFFEAKNLLEATFDKDFDGDTDQPERSFVVGWNVQF
ncbi:MAG: TonB-dependent receptor plug domain-containing protein [Brevinema sp.]